MNKYFIDTGYSIGKQKAWVIAEVDKIWERGKYMSGKYVRRLANYYYTGRKGMSTGMRLKWRFRDNAWECAALLIKIIFNDNFHPTGEEEWLKMRD